MDIPRRPSGTYRPSRRAIDVAGGRRAGGGAGINFGGVGPGGGGVAGGCAVRGVAVPGGSRVGAGSNHKNNDYLEDRRVL